MNYYEALVASGATHDEATRHVYANEIQSWRNREHPMYGRIYEAEQIADSAPTTDFYEAR